MNKIIAEFLRCTARTGGTHKRFELSRCAPESERSFPMLMLLRSDASGILRELSAEGGRD